MSVVPSGRWLVWIEYTTARSGTTIARLDLVLPRSVVAAQPFEEANKVWDHVCAMDKASGQTTPPGTIDIVAHRDWPGWTGDALIAFQNCDPSTLKRGGWVHTDMRRLEAPANH